MHIQNNIEHKLLSHFKPEHLEVIKDSSHPHVPAGSESHFKVVIVTPEFAGERLINRHRAVNAVLKDELQNDIHALALHTYTESEWQKLFGEFPTSPNCLGGSKHKIAS
jgi:BolA protein